MPEFVDLTVDHVRGQHQAADASQPPHHRQGMDGALDLDNDEVRQSIEQRQDATASNHGLVIVIPTQRRRAPVETTTKVRVRGRALMVIGALYPQAQIHIHPLHIGRGVTESDFEARADVLWHMRGVLDLEAEFRVTMVDCDRPTAAELKMWWWDAHMLGLPGSGGLTADEYVNVLSLGGACVGRLMMFTEYTQERRRWYVARQLPGKDYSLHQCLSIFEIQQQSHYFDDFGPKNWTNGDQIPDLYVCKDMSVKQVASKIRNIMR